MPKVLLLGATGGCGSPALIKLLSKRAAVTAIVRSADRLPAEARGHELLTVVVLPDGHLVLSDTEMAEHMRGCDAVISSLGHNLTLWGMYGTPRKLCTDTVRQLCRVAELLQPMNPIRLIAISTEGVDRPDGADPPRGRGERLVLWLLWLLLPPHADNLAVVDYLHRSARRRVGKRPPGSATARQPGLLGRACRALGCSRGAPKPLRSPRGVWVPHLEFSACQELEASRASPPGAHEPARRVLRSAAERHDRQ